MRFIMLDLGFMIWLHKLNPLPQRWGESLLKKSAQIGFKPATILTEDFFG